MATCEYQEARMEGKEGKEGERNWDRRSLRRKNKDKVRKRAEDEIKNVSVTSSQILIQWEQENSAIRRRLLDSSYDF